MFSIEQSYQDYLEDCRRAWREQQQEDYEERDLETQINAAEEREYLQWI
jgi:hypothetical protein